MTRPTPSQEQTNHLIEEVVVLIGLRGSGKTTIGRALAERLDCPWSDLDDRALALCDEPTIQAVFDGPGAASWRAAEARALEEALTERPSVLSLGGGAPCVPEVLEALNLARRERRARVIWLDASSECLARRIGAHDLARPPLRAHPDGSPLTPLEESDQLRSERSDAYRALADRMIDTDAPLEQVLEELLGS